MNNFKYTFNNPIRIFADGGIIPDDTGYASADGVFNGFTNPNVPTEEPQFNPVPIQDVTPDSELIPLKSVDNVTKKAGNRYTIKKGDSLWKIARNHGMSVSELLKENPNLSINDTIYAGDQINVGNHKAKTKITRKNNNISSRTRDRRVSNRTNPLRSSGTNVNTSYVSAPPSSTKKKVNTNTIPKSDYNTLRSGTKHSTRKFGEWLDDLISNTLVPAYRNSRKNEREIRKRRYGI